MDTYNKIYSRISSDFYAERSGDRTVLMYLPPAGSLHYSAVNQQMNNCWGDFFNKLKDGIVVSFQHRNSLYDIDIKRLEQTRNTQLFDFKKLFLVRESLALLYQMMQLNDQSLQQYEELELLLDSLPSHNLPENEWPMNLPEALKTEQKPDSGTTSAEDSNMNPKDLSASISGSSSKKEKERDCMSDAVKNGDDITVYSINLARMKILKNRLSFNELKKYLLSRQLYFLILLKRPVQYAERSLKFLKDSIEMIQAKYPLFSYDYLSEECHDSMILPNKEFLVSLLRIKQMEVWALTSSIKLLRVCRDLIYKIFEFENHPGGANNNTSSSTLQRSFTQAVNSLMSLESRDSAYHGAGKSLQHSKSFNFSEQYADSVGIAGVNNTVSLTGGNEGKPSVTTDPGLSIDDLYLYKEAFIACNDLLHFALQRFNRLCCTIKYSKIHGEKISSNIVKNHLKLLQPGSSITDSNVNYNNSSSNGSNSSLSASKAAKAQSYFSHFLEDEKKFTSAAELLQKDLLDSKFLEDGNLETSLAAIMGRVRTASHFWAKIYNIDENEFGKEIKQNEDFIFQQYQKNFSKSQLEKGKILEVSIALYLFKCSHEINILCQR
jgi:hypothetical protein